MEWPLVSRSRYARELRQLREAHSSSSSDLREKLSDLIQHFTTLKMYSVDRLEMIEVRYVFNEYEMEHMSPYMQKELWWHISNHICERMQKEIALRMVKATKP